MPTPKPHPHAYTLQLLRLSLDRLPPGFSDEEKKRVAGRLAYFEMHPEADYGDIHKTIVELGRFSWPLRKAYADLYARYGRASEEAQLLSHLDAGVRKKYEDFIHAGGKLNFFERAANVQDFMQPPPFERIFSPEEKFAIEQALLNARDAARAEIDGLVQGPKKDDYAALVAAYKEKERKLDDKIDELRGLAAIEPKWEAEIMDKVRTFEEGWSVVEREVDEMEIDGELENWRGRLQSFLEA